ncbi:MAG TPA: hypothetical protein VEZ11_13110 [Thermoanaerobaculia bacterium]|nr:hypothetical protein [Thermoanaerobaculia bacterium]
MKLKVLENTPPWEWPESAAKTLLDVLRDGKASEADLLLAAELAGDMVVINDSLVDALLAIVRDAGRSAELRGRAAIALGPVLETGDTQEFDDPDDVPISEETFHRIQDSLRAV